MPPKHHHQITEYIDSDDECPSPHIIQNHTHILSSSHGLSTNNTYYEMPASPMKQPTHMADDPILWREDEPMSQGNEFSDEDEMDLDLVGKMLEPGYVSNVRDEAVKHSRGWLGVRCSIPLFHRDWFIIG